MFSGKSEELIRRLRRAEIAGQRALIVKPLIDTRFDVGHVVSHAGAKMRAVTARNGAEVGRLAVGYDAVGIDEVQFFDDGVVEAIESLVRGGTRVVAAGLAQDFRGLPFGEPSRRDTRCDRLAPTGVHTNRAPLASPHGDRVRPAHASLRVVQRRGTVAA